MLFDLFGTADNEEEYSDEQDDKQQYDFGKIASPEVCINGSVHASGEAYITINCLHSIEEAVPIAVNGSIHKTGSGNVEVMQHKQETDFPEPADSAKGFSQLVSDELRETSNVHNPGNSSLSIEELAIFPSDHPELIVSLHNNGYSVYDRVALYGSVHATGAIDVTIDDLYVYPDVVESQNA
jgi:hypothetical protein